MSEWLKAYRRVEARARDDGSEREEAYQACIRRLGL